MVELSKDISWYFIIQIACFTFSQDNMGKILMEKQNLYKIYNNSNFSSFFFWYKSFVSTRPTTQAYHADLAELQISNGWLMRQWFLGKYKDHYGSGWVSENG